MVIESYFIDRRAGQGQSPHFCRVLKMWAVLYPIFCHTTKPHFLPLLSFKLKKKKTCLGTNAAFDERGWKVLWIHFDKWNTQLLNELWKNFKVSSELLCFCKAEYQETVFEHLIHFFIRQEIIFKPKFYFDMVNDFVFLAISGFRTIVTVYVSVKHDLEIFCSYIYL